MAIVVHGCRLELQRSCLFYSSVLYMYIEDVFPFRSKTTTCTACSRQWCFVKSVKVFTSRLVLNSRWTSLWSNYYKRTLCTFETFHTNSVNNNKLYCFCMLSVCACCFTLIVWKKKKNKMSLNPIVLVFTHISKYTVYCITHNVEQ